ncbi:MAG: 3-isopropylmalate dehydratase small subunit, partial [Methylococcaceae bacterium]
DIFYNNCFKNGILAIKVNKDQLDKLMAEINANEGVRFVVDLENQQVTTPAGNGFTFDIDPFRKGNLLSGLDDIGLTLKHIDKITEYEKHHKEAYPWLWA